MPSFLPFPWPVRRCLPSIAVAAVSVLAGCATPPVGPPPAASTAVLQARPGTAVTPPVAPGADVSIDGEPAPQPAACPSGVPAGTRCWRGTDRAGAPYLVARPAVWTGVLVMHAHGGPTLGPPQATRADEDLQRWAVTLRAGHAWAGSVFRQGGVAVTAAADDTERLRRLVVRDLMGPHTTIVHGQSWGAGVAMKVAERYGAPGATSPYAGVLLTSGVLGGVPRSYDARLDLRVVYQALCGNHPRPDEPDYPLWAGLPEGSTLTRAELARRVDDCLGLARPAAQRTPQQADRLRQLVAVTKLPAASLQGHLQWATWHFQDIALRRTGGHNVFGNERVRYRGSDDDGALNARVARYRADPAAVAAFAADASPTGRTALPMLSLHAIGDTVAAVELQAEFATTVARAGTADRLVQAYVDHDEHSYWRDPIYLAAFDALLGWAGGGAKPTPAGLGSACEARRGAADDCRFRVDFRPPPLASRVPAR